MHRAADTHPDLDAQTAVDLDLAVRLPVNVMVTAGTAARRLIWARTIHMRSARSERPFVAVCSPVVDVANRADGAIDVDEWFEGAAGGTLFIDHVGRLNPRAQAQLLSRLADQARHASAPASSSTNHAVRIVAGSDRSLRVDLAVGAFSRELFYRLNVIHIDQVHGQEAGADIMKARDIMSREPYTCEPSTDLATVVHIMWDHDCGFVPVVDTSGAVVGVVTDRDICIATATRRTLPEHMSAAQAMTTPIHACLSNDSISDVLATMKRCQVRRVPVIDAGGRLQGVISLNDLVLASNDAREPRASDVVSAMAAICAHRQVERMSAATLSSAR